MTRGALIGVVADALCAIIAGGVAAIAGCSSDAPCPPSSIANMCITACDSADEAIGGEVCKNGTWQCKSGVTFESCGVCVQYLGLAAWCCGSGQEVATPTCALDAGWSCAVGTYSTTRCEVPDAGSQDAVSEGPTDGPDL